MSSKEIFPQGNSHIIVGEVNTALRPGPETLIEPLAGLVEALTQHFPSLDIQVSSSFGLSILNQIDPRIQYARHPRDFDFSTDEIGLNALTQALPTLNTSQFRFMPGSLKVESLGECLVPQMESYRLVCQLLYQGGFVYELEVFNNLEPEFIRYMLGINIRSTKDIPVIHQKGLTIWHPTLIKVFYEKLSVFEELSGLKSAKSEQRQATIAAAQRAACLNW